MKVLIELLVGNERRDPTAADMDKNIAAIDRAIAGKKSGVSDDTLLMDTRSILIGIQNKLRN